MKPDKDGNSAAHTILQNENDWHFWIFMAFDGRTI
jgi:hypothetical protein